MNSSDISDAQNHFKKPNNYNRKRLVPISRIICGQSTLESQLAEHIESSYVERSIQQRNKAQQIGRNLNFKGSFRNSNRSKGLHQNSNISSINSSYHHNLFDTKSFDPNFNTLNYNPCHILNNNKRNMIKSKVALTNNTVNDQDVKRNILQSNINLNLASKEKTKDLLCQGALPGKTINSLVYQVKKIPSITKPQNNHTKSTRAISQKQIDTINNDTILSNTNAITLPTESDYVKTTFSFAREEHEQTQNNGNDINNNCTKENLRKNKQINNERNKENNPIKKLNLGISNVQKIKFQLKKSNQINRSDNIRQIMQKSNQSNVDITNNEKKNKVKQCIQSKIKEEHIETINYAFGQGIETIFNLHNISNTENTISEYDSFDDMNSVIKKINFYQVHKQSINIFSNDNSQYKTFSIAFNDLFDESISKQRTKLKEELQCMQLQ